MILMGAGRARRASSLVANFIFLAGFLAACDDAADDLAGRWELVTVNDVPLVEASPIRLGDSGDHDQGWIEEKLLSRGIEVFDEEREFFDRSVFRITIMRESAVDTALRPAPAPIVRTEVIDTLLLTVTVEIEGDSIGFRPSPVAGRIQRSRPRDSEMEPPEVRGAIRIGPPGSGVPYVLVGTREGTRLRLQGPDGTIFTFERGSGSH